MDIHQELARIFANAGRVAIPKLTDTEARAVIKHEKYHDEYAAYLEDELRLIVSSLETARETMQLVYTAARRNNLPITQMIMCADDCMEESIQEINKKLGK